MFDTDVVDCRPTRAWKSPTEAGEKPHLHHYGRTDVNVSVNFKGKQTPSLVYFSRRIVSFSPFLVGSRDRSLVMGSIDSHETVIGTQFDLSARRPFRFE